MSDNRPRIDQRRGVFMISVAAELAEMHPQTLRMYETRGLIRPSRSAKNTRLYSHADVERLRVIQHLTVDEGLNLAGVEAVLSLQAELRKAERDLARTRARAAELERMLVEQVERARNAGVEIVPYGAYEVEGLTPQAVPIRAVAIPVTRLARRRPASP